MNANVYTVYVSCPESDLYNAVVDHSIGTFTINQKVADVKVTAATDILKNQSLSQSVISGSADVDGVFTWKEPNKVMATTGPEGVLFTPGNPNYKVAEGSSLTATVTVIDTKADLRILKLTVNGQEYGDPVKLELNGAEVAAGALVTKDDKLKVTAIARNGSNVKVSVTNAMLADGVYMVGETGNVVVTVTYSQTPGPDPDVRVTGVSLNKSNLNITPGQTETLVATITPSNATNQAIAWTSSDETIATVDASGKVTAVKMGKATITVRTNDGGHTATCLVNVGHPVGLDEDLADTKVYVQDGSICIVPASPMNVFVANVTSRPLFNEHIDNAIRISVEKGIYFVRFGVGNKVVVKKISVR